MPPECLAPAQDSKLQIELQRDVLLQSLHTLDDNELDMALQLRSAEEGLLKIIKTRDQFIVQCTVPLTVEQNLSNDEDYGFPEEQLLLKADQRTLKNLKTMFKKTSDVVEMKFTRDVLSFRQPASAQEHEIKCS